MRQPWEWHESDILGLIHDQVPESTTLDYKASAALARTDSKKIELTKDVSSFANAAGGVLIYGVTEKNNIPTGLDEGYDPKDISREWLENVINSGIQRRIDGIRINPVPLTSKPGRVLYVLYIPQSLSAPHMAADKRFYKRFNFQSVPMEEYEVRDVGRRSEAPDLRIELAIAQIMHPVVKLAARIVNDAPEPAFHAAIRIYIEPSLKIISPPGFAPHPDQLIPIRGFNIRMQVLYLQWSAPPRLPIWETEMQSLNGDFIHLGYPRGVEMHHIAWHVTSPKMGIRIGMYGLNEGLNGPELTSLEYAQ